MSRAPALTLLYDAECGVCDATVQTVLRADPGGPLRFAALQGDFAAGVVSRHPRLRDVDSLILVQADPQGQEHIAVRSEAALALAAYLGGRWRLLLVGRLVPRRIRDGAYDLFARHRHRLLTRPDQCRVPSSDERARFVDE
jgi:predicted DCC family thiol-disulfide oxidoreductase YuxK